MSTLKLAIAAVLALATAACATTPPPEVAPPAKKQYDAKTQLETGKKY